jgi:signal transduction histidine kinase
MRNDGKDDRRTSDSMARLWVQAVHDLRQPVQTARLLASLLDAAGGREELQRAAHGIGSALQSLHEMLEALTLIARTEAGLIVVELTTCRLADALEPMLGELEEIAAQRGVLLRVGALEGEVRSHPRLLTMLARSLVLNAIRFGNGEEILVGCRRNRDRLTLEVRYGCTPLDGRMEAHAFVQLAPTGDSLSAGELGLGLALLHRLCCPLRHELACTASGPDRQCLTLTMPLPAAASLRVIT